uniref:Uncharacterized protein n=1 Tax=Tetranychus urticae TaxID=32264 RepID=T1KX66_TETUR
MEKRKYFLTRLYHNIISHGQSII